MKTKFKTIILAAALLGAGFPAAAQKYNGIVDKSVAVGGGELITLSEIEQEVQMMNARGYASDRNIRCELLENMMKSKLFLMQARLDSLTVNQEMVEAQLGQQLDQVRTALGGDEGVESYFHKPIYKLRQEWRRQIEDNTLTQQEQQEIASKVPEVTPYDVKQYIDTSAVDRLPVVPIKYKISQICIYPDREAAALAVKERLLSIRERIQNGEKFATLARLYSEDPGSARKGGELGMASRSIFWPIQSGVSVSFSPGLPQDRHHRFADYFRTGRAFLFPGLRHQDQRRTDGRPFHRLRLFRNRPAQAPGLRGCQESGNRTDIRARGVPGQRRPQRQPRL